MGTPYRRLLLKLSGGAIAGEDGSIFGAAAIDHIVAEILSVRSLGIEVAIVIGGGNVFRGRVSEDWNIERAEADNIGMLGTVINAVMLRAALTARAGQEVRVMSAVPIPSMAEPYIRLRADRHLGKGAIVILAGGNGQPYVTTDYPAVQRAIELRCDAVLAAKDGVDGVFTADPRLDPAARKYASLAFADVVRRDLRVMDQAAILLARDHGLPLHIFNFTLPGAMRRICEGEKVGTLVAPSARTVLAES
ncbi:uridylate kinase [Inquilinus ginsengisoli]|uniref:Uridylate kinase n=1 Tax=Inquilinus ginsengisoli TaxID=363840 RepID=A0ABU1JX33_9PROT|nr:UMP kinase [Inquilinus ginsengisoli]MDR6292110.1 uridylate kinase [Inquilinus ginsengisoli]